MTSREDAYNSIQKAAELIRDNIHICQLDIRPPNDAKEAFTRLNDLMPQVRACVDYIARSETHLQKGILPRLAPDPEAAAWATGAYATHKASYDTTVSMIHSLTQLIEGTSDD